MRATKQRADPPAPSLTPADRGVKSLLPGADEIVVPLVCASRQQVGGGDCAGNGPGEALACEGFDVTAGITHGQHAALLMGDAEHWAEQRLLATHPTQLTADLLKVGHHGSRTSSSPDFLQAVQPHLATLSAGIRNRFAHPHPETLAHLHAAGAHPLRLDQLGSITWQTDGTTQHLQTWLTGNIDLSP